MRLLKKHHLIIATSAILLQGCYVAPHHHEPSHGPVEYGYSDVNIGIHYSTYPDLVVIPGYPVYYAPRLNSNYFFYDGLYWVFHSDNWYVSGWYNGPWNRVSYYEVPVYVLRIPVRYYRRPPPYFRDWHPDEPPHWGEHWGRDWERRRSGWDRWDHRSTPAPAPLPHYQRNYSGDRYPHSVEQQRNIRSENYRYQPHDPVAQEHFQQRREQDQQRQQDERREQFQQREQYERQLEQQRQQEERLEQLQQRQLEQQRQQEERLEQLQQRQLEQQRQQEKRLEQLQQRQLEQQRQQEERLEQLQQRQLEQQRRQEERLEQFQQRQLEQQREQYERREQYQLRQPEPQRTPQDREGQSSQPEPGDRARDGKAAPNERGPKDLNDEQQYEQRRNGHVERDQYR